MIENKHYELIPGDDNKWNVRILEGPYTETVIQYGTLIPTDAGKLNWGMNIIETPDPDLTRDDEEFQAWCGAILSTILENEHLQSKKKMI
jgi:hypothetical protein